MGTGPENFAGTKAPVGAGPQNLTRRRHRWGAGQPGPAAPVNFGWGHILLLKWRNNHFLFQTYVSISRCEQSKN